MEFGDHYFESCESAGGRFRGLDVETDPDTYRLVPRARYFITDHLGSTRVILNPDGTIHGMTDYLPYGKFLLTTGAWRENNDYLWTGKEQLTPFFEANWYDSGARYLFTNGLFASLDPLAEKYPGISPYAYCAGDPVNRVDPDGNIWETALDVASVVMGVNSFSSNVNKGNVGGAIVDGIGIVLDAAAVVTPFIPAIASTSIATVRGLNKGAEALKAADTVSDAARTVDRAADAAKGVQNAKSVKTFQTYTKTNKETGQVYVGRTSGYGSPEQNVNRRDKKHHMNSKGYGEAILDKSSHNPDAIRGQEQYSIDMHGGAQSQGGTSGNAINSISKTNSNRQKYEEARRKEFRE